MPDRNGGLGNRNSFFPPLSAREVTSLHESFQEETSALSLHQPAGISLSLNYFGKTNMQH